MADPYERVKGNRLAFKGGDLATRSKPISKDKKKKKKKKHHDTNPNHNDATDPSFSVDPEADPPVSAEDGIEYTIDAAKRKKYDDLFPVEARKFGYDPKSKSRSVEDALEDRVKKKADRYCK
ncbi:hypothetical protein FNV43_RR21108 [Rhamnella rubrinervis]|uniref:Uncharacterized protein n=1 Tax=Rhamnella rubrinervis TaxID=2594499 RepID=A0A8K0E133_9ROSA|nr:hypothetical protein FNV43_RR21108 [Rhamnella rubrinervis]